MGEQPTSTAWQQDLPSPREHRHGGFVTPQAAGVTRHPARLLDLICSFTPLGWRGGFAWGAKGRGVPGGSRRVWAGGDSSAVWEDGVRGVGAGRVA